MRITLCARPRCQGRYPSLKSGIERGGEGMRMFEVQP